MRRRFLGYKAASGVKTNNLKISFANEQSGVVVPNAMPYPDGSMSGTSPTNWVAQETGKVNLALKFVSKAKIVIPDNAEYRIRNASSQNRNLAFSFWVKISSINSDGLWLFNKRLGTTESLEYQFNYYQGTLNLIIWNTDGTSWKWSATYASTNLTTNTFIHFSGYTDYATNQIRIFKDNVEILGATITGEPKIFNTSTSSLAIGMAAWVESWWLVGSLDEFRLWTGQSVPTDFSNEWNNGNGITL